MNSATPRAGFLPRPIPPSLSHNSRLGTAPKPCNSSHIPSNRSVVVRVGRILAMVNLEYAAVITNTGRSGDDPSSRGIAAGGNHKSHWITSPASHTNLSAGSTRRYSGRMLRTFSRNQDSDPTQPTRSANTTAGISGSSSNIARTRGSKGVNDVSFCRRSYFGGSGDETAFTTVVRETPKRRAICVFGMPSAASLLINAQSSKVITLQSSRVFTFQASKMFNIQASSTEQPVSSELAIQSARSGSVGRELGSRKRSPSGAEKDEEIGINHLMAKF